MSQEEVKRAAEEAELPQPKRIRNNFSLRSNEDCAAKIDAFHQLNSDGRAPNIDDLDWRPGSGAQQGSLEIFNKKTGKSTAVIDVPGEAIMFTGGDDPAKIGIKVSVLPDTKIGKQIMHLFHKRLPEAMFKYRHELSKGKDGKKPLVTSKWLKAMEKAEDPIIYVLEEILLDESGPHIPLKVWDREGETRKYQLATTHKCIKRAYQGSPLTADEVDAKVPKYLRETAHNNLATGILYDELSFVGTEGDQISDPTEAPGAEFNGTVRFWGVVKIFVASVRSEQIKYTVTKPTEIKVLGFQGGQEKAPVVSANSLFD